MEQPPQTDEELVRAFQRGDRQAFGRLIERHQDRLYRLALAWLGNSDFAEDAVQEAFLRGFNSLPRFRFGATPFSWLYRTLRNICHEINRRQSKLKAFGDAELDIQTDQTGHRAAGEQSLERIRALIAKLPTRQQEVVLLRLFEECSEEETANAMGCRRGTVKALLHKARQQLQLGLQEERVS
ncbi:MAG: RNA polymerase sigma factor [SAR324 cluster bacterium]|nr:RNA polymerase sigma factor [SAR324 cluster bacterium]